MRRSILALGVGLLFFAAANPAEAVIYEYDIVDPFNVPGYPGLTHSFGLQFRNYTSPLPGSLRADKVSYGGNSVDLKLTLDTDAGTVNVGGRADMKNVPVERHVIGDRSTFEGMVDVDFTWGGVHFTSTDYNNPSALQFSAASTSSGQITYLDGAYAGGTLNFFPKAAAAGYTMNLRSLSDGRIVLDGWFNLLGYSGNADFVFQAVPITRPPETEVPEPASALLMLTGLAGALRRRKAKQSV